jgi:class 3 adenylate cyclase
MIEVVADYNVSHGHTFELRVGVSCGPLTAGVIGSRKFSYDIWGDTVNVASRMESTGIPGRVQVTEAVARVAAEHFEFEDRGLVSVKGKGKMRTFLVSSRDA